MSESKYDPSEARDRAEIAREDPKVMAWMRRARKLFNDQPPGTWIYWQEDTMNLMVRSASGETYANDRTHGAGNDQAAVIDNVRVPGSDAGAW